MAVPPIRPHTCARRRARSVPARSVSVRTAGWLLALGLAATGCTAEAAGGAAGSIRAPSGAEYGSGQAEHGRHEGRGGHEEHGGHVTVHPGTVRPGERVDLRVAPCGRETRVTATSLAFATEIELVAASTGQAALTASAAVRADIRPGHYPVRVHCPHRPPRELDVTILVLGVDATPHAPVAAGGGATAGGRDGDGGGGWALGGVAALAGAALLLRLRSRTAAR